MKNYYEILEVDRNASKEVIEKAYRTLAKKYHPDLKSTTYSQERMQKINEAYEVLSSDFKRKEYNLHLEKQSVPFEEYEKVKKENVKLKKELQKYTNKYEETEEKHDYGNSIQFMKNYYNELRKKTTNNTQNNSVKKTRKKIKLSKKTIQELIVIAIIIILIIAILATIPTTRQFFVNLYNNNFIVKFIVDVFRDTFSRGF